MQATMLFSDQFFKLLQILLLFFLCAFSPYLIGTMTQSRAASITCLQFHQNFRWVLFSLTEEPVKSFLARFLHRQWAEKQFRQSGSEDRDCGLLRVVDWMPKVWQHVNRFVAAACCPDKCIG